MTRRRFVALGGIVVLAALVGLARVLAPGEFDSAVKSGQDLLEGLPDPVVLAATVVGLTVVFVVVLVYVVRVYYWAWRQVEGPVTRFWNALLPESPIVRFGVGVTVMVLVFLIGPLVVLQALDFFENDDPVEQQQNDTDDDSENATDTDDETGTASVHTADRPDSPDEPPGRTGGVATG
jgi:hypothetical protein